MLALLLLDVNRVVSTDRIVDALWGEEPPRTAATSLQNFVSQLRKLLGSDVVVTKPPGYQLRVEPEQLDLERFTRLVEESRVEPPAERAAKLRRALAPGSDARGGAAGRGGGGGQDQGRRRDDAGRSARSSARRRRRRADAPAGRAVRVPGERRRAPADRAVHRRDEGFGAALR